MSRHVLWVEIGADHACDLSQVNSISGVRPKDYGPRGELIATPKGGMRPRLFSHWLYETGLLKSGRWIDGLGTLREIFEPVAAELRQHVQSLGAEITVGVDIHDDAERDEGEALSVRLSQADLHFIASLGADFLVQALPRSANARWTWSLGALRRLRQPRIPRTRRHR